MASQPSIAVVGSVNMDVVSVVAAFPQPGETVHARSTAFHSGGKGANQAVAAAAAGAAVEFIGAVGDDAFAEPLAAGLAGRGVGIAALARQRTTSGQAFITVDAAGQNTIILAAGANGQVTAREVEAARAPITRADALLTQNEIPWEATFAALALAHDAGVRVIANPAPAFELPGATYPLIDALILNEIEAATLTQRAVVSIADAERAAAELIGRGARPGDRHTGRARFALARCRRATHRDANLLRSCRRHDRCWRYLHRHVRGGGGADGADAGAALRYGSLGAGCLASRRAGEHPHARRGRSVFAAGWRLKPRLDGLRAAKSACADWDSAASVSTRS